MKLPKKFLTEDNAYEVLFESISEGVAILAPKGAIKYCNKAFSKMLGVSQAKLIGTSIVDLVASDEVQKLISILTKSVNKNTKAEFRIKKKNGRIVPVLMSCNALELEKAGLCVVIADLTEQKNNDLGLIKHRQHLEELVNERTKALIESEEKYRELVKSAPAGIYEVDFRAKKYTSINDAMCLLTGYSREELLSMSPFDILDDEGKIAFQSRLAKWLKGKKPDENVEYKIKTKDGRIIYALLKVKFTVDENGKPLGATVIGYDITERKRAKAELLDSEKRFKTLYSSMTEGLAVHDIVYAGGKAIDYVLTDINPAFEKITGLARSHVIGKKASDVYGTTEAPYLDIYAKVAATGVPDNCEVYFAPMKKHFSISVFSPGKGKFATIFQDITERKIAANTLKESEERYRSLFDTMLEGFCVIEMVFDEQNKPLDYRFLEINPAFERQTGLRNAKGKLMRDLAPEHEAHWFEIYGNIALTGEPGRFVNQARALNRWYEVSAFRVGGSESRKVAIFFNDISESKRAENALRESEQRLKFHFENSPLAVVEWDAKFIVTQWSSEAERIFGWKKDETIGKRIDTLNIIYEADIPIVNHTIERLTSGKEITVVSSNRNYTKSGSIIECTWHNSVLLDQKGNMSSVMSLVEDITERRKAEKALKASEQKYRDLVETANSMILRWTPDGIISYVNECGLKFFGYTWEEMVGKDVQMTLPDRDSVTGADLTRLAENIANDPETYKYSENENVKKNGERAWVIWANKAYRDERGAVREILCIGNDITELKMAKDVLSRDKATLEKMVKDRTRELLQAHAELEHAKRLSDIGVLAATVAHELRNPLAAINMAAHNIKRKANNPELEKHFTNIQKKVIESDQIINNLLFYSRLKPPHLESIKFSEVLEECIESLENRGKKEVKMIKDLGPIQNVRIEADPLQIKELIINILNNAVDAMPSERGRIKIAAENENEFVKVSIEDNGSGMDKNDLEKAFDPFFTTKAKGTGLGLSVCRQIVNMHGGTIELKSEPRQGTTVIVRLPKKGDTSGL